MQPFTIYPAIDLRQGQVVRLKQGDPAQQTVYGNQPSETAQRWLASGATWLHVINLDGAFGEVKSPNEEALQAICSVAHSWGAKVQSGGGMRSLKAIEKALQAGAARVVLGTLAIEQPQMVSEALSAFGKEAIAVGLDAREGYLCTRGWQTETEISALDFAQQLATLGINWIIFTDIARDGVGSGVNLEATQALVQLPGLKVIASGGVNCLEDINQSKHIGCAGIIIGRALYDASLSLEQALGLV